MPTCCNAVVNVAEISHKKMTSKTEDKTEENLHIGLVPLKIQMSHVGWQSFRQLIILRGLHTTHISNLYRQFTIIYAYWFLPTVATAEGTPVASST